MKYACNYAIARFLPYPETGEFVNIGVALMCPEAGFFDFLFACEDQRVTQFFRDLDLEIYVIGLKDFCEEMKALREGLKKKTDGRFESEYAKGVIRELVKPRESIFRFSPPRTTLTDDPEEELRRLFEYYVERKSSKSGQHSAPAGAA